MTSSWGHAQWIADRRSATVGHGPPSPRFLLGVHRRMLSNGMSARGRVALRGLARSSTIALDRRGMPSARHRLSDLFDLPRRR